MLRDLPSEPHLWPEANAPTRGGTPTSRNDDAEVRAADFVHNLR